MEQLGADNITRIPCLSKIYKSSGAALGLPGMPSTVLPHAAWRRRATEMYERSRQPTENRPDRFLRKPESRQVIENKDLNSVKPSTC
jgi:hypothetical protein